MNDKVRKCVQLKFECQQLTEKVYSASEFAEANIDKLQDRLKRNKIHGKGDN
jgi:hypothetical protein